MAFNGKKSGTPAIGAIVEKQAGGQGISQIFTGPRAGLTPPLKEQRSYRVRSIHSATYLAGRIPGPL